MVKLTVTNQIKTVSMQSGKTMKVSDGSSYTYYGSTKKECEKQARDKSRWNGYRKEWEKVEDDE